MIGTPHDPEHWRAAGGNIQSVTFYLSLCNALLKTDPFKTWATWVSHPDGSATVHQISIDDYGCAHGDGTAILKATFPMAQVTGVDISDDALVEAEDRWPTLDFRKGDIEEPDINVDVIIASHVLEHTTDPVGVIENLREHCHALVVVVPTITEDKDGGHIGAVPTDDLIEQMGERIGRYAASGYMTLREDAGNPGCGVVESNNVFIIEGKL